MKHASPKCYINLTVLFFVFTGCTSSLNVGWSDFSRFEWCINHFVLDPQDALKNPNFIKKVSKWQEFIQNELKEEYKSNPKLLAKLKKTNQEHDENAEYHLEEGMEEQYVSLDHFSDEQANDVLFRVKNMLIGSNKVLQELVTQVESSPKASKAFGGANLVSMKTILTLGSSLISAIGATAKLTAKATQRVPSDFAAGLGVLLKLVL